MRRPTAFFAAIAVQAVLAAATPAAAQSSGGLTVVQINHTMRVPVRGVVAQVFVGNAAIADVAVLNHNTLLLTGKGYGTTNVQAVDAAGRTVLSREIQVAGSDQAVVTLYRGQVGTDYTCLNSCQTTPGAAVLSSGAPSAPSAGAGNPLAAAAAAIP